MQASNNTSEAVRHGFGWRALEVEFFLHKGFFGLVALALMVWRAGKLPGVVPALPFQIKRARSKIDDAVMLTQDFRAE
jgi:hypothetical protein